MSFNWNNIRAVEGQREGFEELVCQLVGQEKVDHRVKFTRVGKPDGGKECFWELANGKIQCWQAKYFINSLSAGQWAQIDKSVKDAIDNHPNLEKYYIAIPVDRPDGKGTGKSMLEKWKDHVVVWTEYATSKEMTVSFEYWGKHELEKKLLKEGNEGLIYYFFNEQVLSRDWFDEKNQESINALGGRYTPKLNFALPFLDFRHGLTRNENFIGLFNGHFVDLLDKYRRTYLRVEDDEIKSWRNQLKDEIESFKAFYKSLSFYGVDLIPYPSIRVQLDKLADLVHLIRNKLYDLRDEKESLMEEKGERIDYHFRPYNNQISEIYSLSKAVRDFNDFLDSEICSLANNPYLILIGPAGIGKSHALADIVLQRRLEGRISLLLLGENFSNNEMPWTQTLKNHLRFDGDEDKFLGALNAKAESIQDRIILIIDALNEGNGRRVWPKRLKTFIKSFHKYPWLGLIVSIRDSFEDLIAPEDILNDSIATRLYHPGFGGVEYQASTHFFRYYDIAPPGSPMLHPEFQNPLFLKLFCEGLKKRGLRQIPDGYYGITAIIDNYLEGVEAKLSQPDQLDYDVKLKLLKKSVDGLLEQMVEEGKDHLPYDIAEEIVSEIFSDKCGSDDKQYLKRLISEGVVNDDLYWKEDQHYDGVHFAYQRFQDHLIVSALLDKHLDPKNPEKSFTTGPIAHYVKNESEAYYNQNIIEALSIQVPERIGKELHEVVPHAYNYNAVAGAFIDGLMWRRADTIGEASKRYVNEVLTKNDTLFHRFIRVSISMATKPRFYFNADCQHDYLFKQSLPKRDSWWTIWLQDKYGERSRPNPVKRLVDWARSPRPKEIDIESARLAAVMLTWFLTSSNRYLRDGATKALISLLEDRLTVLLQLLEQFEGINDPYIHERLFAVAYGCVLRTEDRDALIPLAKYIHSTIFDADEVCPHILLRDYARGVIEYCNHLGIIPEIEVATVRPPYKSHFPEKLPSNEEIDSKYSPKDDDGNYGKNKWGATAILSSMTTEYGRGIARYGDFGRYTFQSALSNWDVDYNGLSNYAIQRIFEMGYDPEIFTDFDSRQGSGRGTSHFERIGKKYQWIAFYEILALVSDNCMLIDRSSTWGGKKKYRPYEGPWEPYVRDFDPTILIKSGKQKNRLPSNETRPWWVNVNYPNWEGSEAEWKKRGNDFPDILDMLTVTDPNGIEWLNLNMFPDWWEPVPLGEDGHFAQQKRIWINFGSWLVKRKKIPKIIEVDLKTASWGDWFPSISNRYEVFSREYFWSPAHIFFQTRPYYGGEALPIELFDASGKKIAKAFHTVQYYLWEEEFDCSKTETIAFHKPAFLLSLGLKPSKIEGAYRSSNNEIVCLDPSVHSKGPACLLMRKDYLLNYLNESDFGLVWIVQGEKQITGNSRENLPTFEHKVGGVYYLEKEGKVTGNFKSFIKPYNYIR